MCGIAGIAFSEQSKRTVDERRLIAMRDRLAHRGPDETGVFIDRNIGLAHRRLSIVDLSAGQQPMTNETGDLQIVYNGEIYNHVDFREDLIGKGHEYKTHCDTETILHLYEEHGAGAIEFLRGMFAFAIWDAGKKQLFIARDRLGVKPLYYVHDQDGSLFFASEIKALLAAEATKAEINFAALPDVFANRGTSGNDTIFKNVKRLQPGHFLVWRAGEIEIKKYWDFSFEPKTAVKSERETIEEWHDLFRQAVRLRLMADVPLGMFLSGGIDSSAILAEMATMVDQPVKTFSVAFDDLGANELEFARLVARKFNTEHYETVVSPKQFFDALPGLIWHEDEPLAFDSSVPLYFVSKLAADHVKVVLTGEGSDEIMAGYGRYRKTLLNLRFGANYEAASPAAFRGAMRGGVQILPGKIRQKLNRTFLNRQATVESLYWNNFAVFSTEDLSDLFSDSAREQIGAIEPFAILNRIFDESDAADLLDKLLYADSKTYLHELLMKQDQMSMATSIESRVPFLDHKLVEFTARLPEKFKLRGRTTKWILREAMRNRLPPEILTRKKMGFPVPLGKWLRAEFRHVVDEYVLSERTLARDVFKPETVRTIAREHNAGTADHHAKLWTLINFEIWARQFIDGEKLFNGSLG